MREGTTWQYSLSREPEGDKTTVIRRLLPAAPGENKSFVRRQESGPGLRGSILTLRRDRNALLAVARSGDDARSEPINPPVTVLPTIMREGMSWTFTGTIAGIGVSMPLTILRQEAIVVPAGKFRAWHFRGEAKGPVATVAEEWFVGGIGFVKETVSQRSPTGQLLARRTLELTAMPATGAMPSPTPDFFDVTLSTSVEGTPMDTISADALQIVARWHVRHASGNTKVRAVWIAEETGSVAPPNYQVDEASALAAAPEAAGVFTLSRPPDGWAAGKYRVDCYLQNTLAKSVSVTIVARATPVSEP